MLARHVLPIVLITAMALPAVASGDQVSAATAPSGRTIVVTGDDGGRVSVDFRDGELTVVSEEDGKTSVHVVDMEQVGTLVAEGLEGALASLRDLQLDFHVGADNRITFSHDHETIEVDVNAILAEVHTALEHGFAGFDNDVWIDTRGRDRGEEELRRELRELKRELRDLRRELDEMSR
jgi:hypothetical protein